ncbi:MAG: thiol:disulfide interchange protein DsbA/DsbL [Burkholderiaceae bacterium]|nr:thiol:disulfide interchange protein DsbA/DsbL [Burkholderiaceae bacterium]
MVSPRFDLGLNRGVGIFACRHDSIEPVSSQSNGADATSWPLIDIFFRDYQKELEVNRRDFVIGLGAANLIALPSWAAVDPIEGKDYTRLQQSVPVAVPGKIEVIELFGYWCPHCFHLEPKLEAWVKKLPANVNFRRIPVAWQESQAPFQRLFFALETLSAKSDIHQKVFEALHVQHARLDSDAGAAAFAAANGIDKVKLADAMKGFAVATKMRAATQALAAYQVDGVPTLAINGQFLTSPEQAGGEDQALRVAEALIQKARVTH